MIIGLGLSRTGTTSLCKALELMGMNTLHGGGGLDWFQTGLPPMPQGIDAIIESPLARWFRAADAAYPDARFILTMRAKDQWLASVKWWLHRSPTPKPGSRWFHLRLLMLECVRFNEAVLSHTYDEHYESVLRYFGDRDDLLVIDIAATTSADLWQSLSQFVNRPAPDAPFPHLNRSMK